MSSTPFSPFAGRIIAAPENELTAKLENIRTRGIAVTDLVNVSWQENGLAFSSELIDEFYQTAVSENRSYHPNPQGQVVLREAITEWYRRRGVTVSPTNIIVTPGTSFAYFLLFKLLHEEHGEILCPVPSYPLFDDIAELSGLRVANYPLEESSQWMLWADRVRDRIVDTTRAICLVSPHNPTGAVHSEEELTELGAVCRRNNLPVVFDEVFSEFRYDVSGKISTTQLPRPLASNGFPITFLLNGFSKSLAMPGHKIGWIVVDGTDRKLVEQAVKALSYLSDTFLPVNEVAQAFAARVLSHRDGATVDGLSRQIAENLAMRRQIVIEEFSRNPITEFHPPAGGVYFVAALPSGVLAESVCAGLLDREQIVVHPGYFYNLSGEHIVFTFIMEPERLRGVVRKVNRFLNKLTIV